jgi:hypothetical protein
MNYAELQDFVQFDILNRDDSDLPDKIKRAINLIHRDIQNIGDWRCMERNASITFAANALTAANSPPSDYKKAIALSDAISPSIIIEPMTEQESNELRLVAETEFGAPALTVTDFKQRWYEYQRQIRLLIAPTTTATFRLDYYAILPSYTVDASTDYFSQHHWNVLVFGAASVASVGLWEDTRVAELGTIYTGKLKEALEQDQAAKLAGSLNFKRPPVHGGKI